MFDSPDAVIDRQSIDLPALLEGAPAETAVAPKALRLGGAHDLLYALLASDMGMRPALKSMDIWRGLVAAESQLKEISPRQIHHVARVHLDDGTFATVDGVEDSLTFLELYRGVRRYLGVNPNPNRYDVDDLMEAWLCPFIGGKIERAPRVAQALRSHLWDKLSALEDPKPEWDRLSRRLSGRFHMSHGFLSGTR